MGVELVGLKFFTVKLVNLKLSEVVTYFVLNVYRQDSVNASSALVSDVEVLGLSSNRSQLHTCDQDVTSLSSVAVTEMDPLEVATNHRLLNAWYHDLKASYHTLANATVALCAHSGFSMATSPTSGFSGQAAFGRRPCRGQSHAVMANAIGVHSYEAWSPPPAYSYSNEVPCSPPRVGSGADEYQLAAHCAGFYLDEKKSLFKETRLRSWGRPGQTPSMCRTHEALKDSDAYEYAPGAFYQETQ
ncbi:hypothetical protein CC86DRAFT_402159 [Ophiobolus disseminans]|uniref:Uncharacterized protein n=1 Tax=Ophiobolus disseminans TaxID=1469910 RepID=A0A6A7AG01_9PLEO|nr:hypothetical protein CC86DRAFT_402159 [Ophiobolus disseminans]